MSSNELLFIHRGLCDGDPAAANRLVQACGERLFRILRQRSEHLLPDELLQDAAFDALLALIKNPQQYDPAHASGSTLINFLTVIAQRRLVDEIRRQMRRKEIAVGDVQDVELFWLGANKGYADTTDGLDGSHSDALSPEIESLLQTLLPDPMDRRLWDIYCEDGRVETAEGAQILGITPITPETAPLVKRHLDRIKKRMQRQRDAFRTLLLCSDPPPHLSSDD